MRRTRVWCDGCKCEIFQRPQYVWHACVANGWSYFDFCSQGCYEKFKASFALPTRT